MLDHNLDPMAAIVLDLVPRASAHQADEAMLLNFFSRASVYQVLGAGLKFFLKSHSGPELWLFEDGFIKSVRKASILRQI